MSSTQPQEPTDPASLQTALETVLRTAHGNDVDVTGIWDCHTPGHGVGWDVEVVPVDRAGDG